MERTGEAQDHALILGTTLLGGMFAHQLDRRFVGFGPRIAQVDVAGESTRGDQFFGKPNGGFGKEHIAGVPQLRRLIMQGSQDLRIAMTERVDRDAGGEIDVLIALKIPEARALAAIEDQRALAIDRQQVFLRRGDQLGRFVHAWSFRGYPHDRILIMVPTTGTLTAPAYPCAGRVRWSMRHSFQRQQSLGGHSLRSRRRATDCNCCWWRSW